MVENINTLVIILVKNEEEGDDVETDGWRWLRYHQIKHYG
jgi:hypothetical protein